MYAHVYVYTYMYTHKCMGISIHTYVRAAKHESKLLKVVSTEYRTDCRRITM